MSAYLNLRSIALLVGFKLGINIGRKRSKSEEIRKFVNRFSEMYVGTQLIRVGASGDGGYLLPPVMDTFEACFSPGVGPTSEFENWIVTNHPMPCFLADASVLRPAIDHYLIDFERKHIGLNDSIDLMRMKTWVDEKTGRNSENLLLQMDIEGAEYAVLSRECETFWSRFNVMVVEFHYLDSLRDRQFLQMFSSILERLYENFRIVHVHPNNADVSLSVAGVQVPRVMEVTFLNMKLLDDHIRTGPTDLPHNLDSPNISSRKDIMIDKMWQANS